MSLRKKIVFLICFLVRTIIPTWEQDVPVWLYTAKRMVLTELSTTLKTHLFKPNLIKMQIPCMVTSVSAVSLIRSHHGTYAITTVGKINNKEEIIKKLFQSGHAHFLEMSGGEINATELVAAIINQKENLIEGLQYAQELVEGSMTMLLMTPKGIYAARDRLGRTPVTIGKKDNAFAYLLKALLT